jgi:hypothetical protein
MADKHQYGAQLQWQFGSWEGHQQYTCRCFLFALARMSSDVASMSFFENLHTVDKQISSSFSSLHTYSWYYIAHVAVWVAD